jgi:hypothetical protein
LVVERNIVTITATNVRNSGKTLMAKPTKIFWTERKWYQDYSIKIFIVYYSTVYAWLNKQLREMSLLSL